MAKSFLSLCLILILGVSTTVLNAKQLHQDNPIVRVMEIEDVGKICTLDPTDRDAHFTVRPAPEVMQRLKSSTSATFEVDYNVPGNNACGDSVWPSEVNAAFDYAMDIWSAHISSPVPIKIEALWTELEERTLGSAGSVSIVQLTGIGQPNTWYTTAQASALLEDDVVSLIDGEYDIRMNINCTFDDWYFGTDGNPPAGTIDFVTVVLHEIGHGIGFSGTLGALPDEDEEDEYLEIGDWGISSGENPPNPFIYDQFAKDGDGNSILDSDIYSNPSEDLYEALTGNRGGLVFDGPDAVASLAGFPIPDVVLYTPEEYAPGSSYSHLDQWTFTDTPNALMRPNMDRSLAIHSMGPLFCAMLSDMEWPLGAGCLSFMAADAIITFNTEEIDFGVTNVNQTVEKTLIITNDSEATETLSGNVSLDHTQFRLAGNSSFSLEPGESESIIVRYQPGSAAVHSSEISIFHNGKNTSPPVNIALTGEALPEDQIVQLNQSYPNPVVGAATTSTIPYVISEDAVVKIDLYTSDGRLVKNLLNQTQNSGRYELNVNLQDLASGIYFYRLIIEDKVETGKLMYTK